MAGESFELKQTDRVPGSGSYGQAGINEDIKKLHTFTPLPIDEKVFMACDH